MQIQTSTKLLYQKACKWILDMNKKNTKIRFNLIKSFFLIPWKLSKFCFTLSIFHCNHCSSSCYYLWPRHHNTFLWIRLLVSSVAFSNQITILCAKNDIQSICLILSFLMIKTLWWFLSTSRGKQPQNS